jgi:hypothetical protein
MVKKYKKRRLLPFRTNAPWFSEWSFSRQLPSDIETIAWEYIILRAFFLFCSVYCKKDFKKTSHKDLELSM